MKRTFTLLVTVLLCLTGIIMPAKAEAIASGTCGDSLTWTLAESGSLTISGTGAMYDYVYGIRTSPWISYAGDIKKVLIEQGVKSIGEGAFCSCRNLTAITIPEGVSSTNLNNTSFSGRRHAGWHHPEKSESHSASSTSTRLLSTATA